MKNIKNLLHVLLFVFSGLFISATTHVDTVPVDSKKSIVKWKGSKISESHEGVVSIQKGVLIIDHGVLRGGQFAIDMNTITTTDIESERGKKRLDAHLRNDDFFSVEEYPSSVITITNAKKISNNKYTITADLTIKGITNSVIFDAEVLINGKNFIANAKIKIDRTKWNIRYGSGSFFEDLGDRMILDDIEFDVNLVSMKR